jgi:pyridoxine kinase
MMQPNPKKAVLVISSHVARGSVGNRAAVFALETLGFPVWAIPTITLPWHPGHGPATRIVAAEETFASFLNDIAKAPWIAEVGAVLTGYMANPEQAKSVAGLVKTIKKNNPDCMYVCDPVIGDLGGLYVPKETANAIRNRLLPICDMATPNRYELGWLLKTETPSTLVETLQLSKELGPKQVLVTSCPMETVHETGNLYRDDHEQFIARHEKFENPPNGPGDLTAAIFLGHILAGMSPEENLRITTSSVFEILANATANGSDELTLESDAQSIVRPKTQISLSCL